MMESVGRLTTMHIKTALQNDAEYKSPERKRSTHAQDIGGTLLTHIVLLNNFALQ
jgi:hypothetical protein